MFYLYLPIVQQFIPSCHGIPGISPYYSQLPGKLIQFEFRLSGNPNQYLLEVYQIHHLRFAANVQIGVNKGLPQGSLFFGKLWWCFGIPALVITDGL